MKKEEVTKDINKNNELSNELSNEKLRPKKEKFSTKKKILISIVGAVLIVTGIVVYVLVFKATTVDLSSYMVEINYNGLNEAACIPAELSVDNDKEDILLKQENDIQADKIRGLLKTVKYTPDKTSGIKNGDIIKITATYDKKYVEKKHLKIKNATFEISVKDIPYVEDNNVYECIKVDNIVYATAGFCAIYQINLESEEVNKIVENNTGYLDYIFYKEGYLYYGLHGNGPSEYEFYRYNTETSEVEVLASDYAGGFNIVGDKICYNTLSGRVEMKLDGSDKKAPTTEYTTAIDKKSNVDSYYVEQVDLTQRDENNPTMVIGEFEYKFNLITPSKTVFICKCGYM